LSVAVVQVEQETVLVLSPVAVVLAVSLKSHQGI